jgi:hypothetical protein
MMTLDTSPHYSVVVIAPSLTSWRTSCPARHKPKVSVMLLYCGELSAAAFFVWKATANTVQVHRKDDRRFCVRSLCVTFYE